MALEMKPTCELCPASLGVSDPAWICSFECTYCPRCASGAEHVCKNCGGELVQRPRRGRVSQKVAAGQHRAEVVWQRGEARFSDRRYSRAHLWRFEGGAELRASSSPHVVPAPLSDPSAVDPEGAFIAALSSCHMLWFLDLAARAGLVVERYEDHPRGSLITRTITPPAETGALERESYPALDAITLAPAVTFAAGTSAAPELLERLHHEAHERCFLANALRAGPRLEL